MKVAMEVIMKVTSAESEDANSDETRTAPRPAPARRIAIPRITVPIIAIAVDRRTLHSISEGIHALTVVSRRCFFSVAPDRSYVTGTMMVELGDLRGFGGGRC